MSKQGYVMKKDGVVRVFTDTNCFDGVDELEYPSNFFAGSTVKKISSLGDGCYKVKWDIFKCKRSFSSAREVKIDREVKDLSKRVNGKVYRVDNPGIKGRKAVESRIQGKNRMAERRAGRYIEIIKEVFGE